MKEKFLIRTVAMKLLEEIYIKCDSSLKATIDAFEIFDDMIDKNLIQKASKYLIDKKLISTSAMACNKWNVNITYIGIDWLEDYHKIDPTLNLNN